MPPDRITAFLAIWGAVVSTIAVAWNILRDVLKRPRVNLKAMFAVNMSRPTTGTCLTVSITNTGHQSIFIQGLAADAGKRVGGTAYSLTPSHLPKRLEPTDYVIEPIRDYSFLGEGVKRLYVWDSTGKEWELPKRKFIELVEQFKSKGV